MQVAAPDFETLTRQEYLSFTGMLLQRIEELEQGRFKDRRIIAEYAELIWGKKSERHVRELAQADLNTSQPEIPFENLPEVHTTVCVSESSAEEPAQTKKKEQYLRKVKPAGRKELSKNLPHEYVEILPENYHQEMIRIDEERTQELDYRPGSFFVRVIIRPRFVDPGTKRIAIAPMPARPVHKGIAGAGLLAYILVSRFCDHLPYYRQVRMINRYGEQIVNTSTMGRWVKESINLLSIIYSRIREKVLQSGYLQADETTIKVLDRNKPSGKHQGYLWGYHAPTEKLVLIEYGEGRAAEYPKAFLGDFRGVFQTDAYVAYDALLQGKGHIIHSCCWAHARRNFFKAKGSDEKRAAEALEMIGELYAVEAAARNKGADQDEILRLRTEHAVPVLEKIKAWAEIQNAALNPKASIAEACRYMLKRWDKLTYYTTDGRVHIDNNVLENRFRPVALGRKNWLFAGNHESAERSGVIYSILESCALNNIEPFSYMKDVLIRLPNLLFAPMEKIDDLLPGNWKPQAEKMYTTAQKQQWLKTG